MTKKDVSTQPIAETITPLRNFEKDGDANRDNFVRRSRLKLLALICSFIVLIVGGVWLLHFLANNSSQIQETEKIRPPSEPKTARKQVAPPKEPLPQVNPAKLDIQKANAEQSLAQYLEAINKLDQKGASKWEGEIYEKIAGMGRQADSLFKNEKYSPASELYNLATSLAKELDDSSGEVLHRLKAAGRKALEDGDGALARHNFSLALEIEPADPEAQHGLRRAETIETVMQLMGSGRQHEADNALSLARDDYSKTLALDPDSKKAQRALHRIDGLIRDQDYQRLMSGGLAAFHQKDYKLARTRLLKAKSLKPDSREVSDALLQVDQALRLSGIERLRRTALVAERSENWHKALESYLAVLDIDKNLQFAAVGKERAQEQIRVAKRIHFYLDTPHAMDSESRLNNAIQLLEEARTMAPRGPVLNTQINELEKRVAIARTPVKITIESDDLTSVAVYRVGKLGRFSVYELELRPGTYTVVGTRDGYQDVRQKIVVKPGLQPMRVTVKCRVKI